MVESSTELTCSDRVKNPTAPDGSAGFNNRIGESSFEQYRHMIGEHIITDFQIGHRQTIREDKV